MIERSQEAAEHIWIVRECLRGGWIRNRITEFTEAWSGAPPSANKNNRLRQHRAYTNEDGSG